MKCTPSKSRPAFSLIEVLVTMFIVALLVGISLPVALNLRTSAKAYTAQSQLSGLAGAADEYNIVTDSVVLPKGDITNPFGGNYTVDFNNNNATNNTIGWFVYQAGSVPTVDKLIMIAAKSALTYQGEIVPDVSSIVQAINADGIVSSAEISGIVILDAWENPVRYAGGTTFVGSPPEDPTNDDDYLPTHPTAFFASAGPDGLWGVVNGDNQPDPSVDVDGDGEPDAADNLYSFEID